MSNSSASFRLRRLAGSPRAPLALPTVTMAAPYRASSSCTIDIPDATPAATDFDVPFGSIASATAVLLKNQGNQALEVYFGASEDVAFELPPGAMVLYASPTDPTTPLASITVTTTAEQDGEGKVACMVFGISSMGSVDPPDDPPYSPLEEPGFLAWWDTDGNTTTADAAVTSLTDHGPNEAHLVSTVTSAPAIYKTVAWDGQPCIHFSADALTTEVAAIINAPDAGDLTVVSVNFIRDNQLQRIAEWSNGAASRYLELRQAGTVLRQEIGPRTSTGTPTTAKEIALNTISPQVRVWRKIGGTVQHGVDGVSETPITISMGTFTLTRFGVGCLPNDSPLIASNFYQRHLFIFSGNKTDAELADLFNFLRTDTPSLAWKAGLGATAGHASGTLIPVIIGQSNGAGRATTPYAHTATRVKNLYHDMFLRDFADPATSPTNSVFSQTDTGGTKNSMLGRLADKFREEGWQHDLLFVNACVGGTSSANWATAATTDPAPLNAHLGRAKHMMWEALKAPGAKLGPIIIYQGETDGANTGDSADWGTNWTTIADELKAEFAGHFHDPDHVFVVVRIAPNVPSGSWPDWADVRAVQATWAAGRSDTEIVDSGNATLDGDLHQDMGADDTEGLRLVAVSAVEAWVTAVTP